MAFSNLSKSDSQIFFKLTSLSSIAFCDEIEACESCAARLEAIVSCAGACAKGEEVSVSSPWHRLGSAKKIKINKNVIVISKHVKTEYNISFFIVY